jgi:hypothetical protein
VSFTFEEQVGESRKLAGGGEPAPADNEHREAIASSPHQR